MQRWGLDTEHPAEDGGAVPGGWFQRPISSSSWASCTATSAWALTAARLPGVPMTRNRDLIGHWPPFSDVLTGYIVPFRAGARSILQSHRMARANHPHSGPAPLQSYGAPHPYP